MDIFEIVVGAAVTLVASLIAFTFRKLSQDTEANNAERIANKKYREDMSNDMHEIKNKVDVIMVMQQEERVEHAKIDIRLDDHSARIEKLEANQERRKS